MSRKTPKIFFFFFNDTATTEIYTLSLHDALPIFKKGVQSVAMQSTGVYWMPVFEILEQYGLEVFLVNARHTRKDRKSTRLNSSHLVISYAVFCLKKKRKSPTSSTLYQECKTPPAS